MPRLTEHDERTELRRLARLRGVQDVYVDGNGRRRVADPEAIIAVLNAMGVAIDSPGRAAGIRRDLRRERARTLCDPVAVVWLGDSRPTLPVRVPGSSDRAVELHLTRADGRRRSWRITPARCDAAADPDGNRVALVPLPTDLPPGVHTLHVQHDRREAGVALLAAPRRCYREPDAGGPGLGLFLPLYAVRSAHDWGIGDLTDLSTLVEWAGSAGCAAMGTLPLLACSLDEPFEPSPYSPISRLVFGEHFLDLDRIARDPGAPAVLRRYVGSPGFNDDLRRAQRGRLVDYALVWRMKRKALALLAEAAFADESRRAELERFSRRNPLLARYARFRGAVARLGADPSRWPAKAAAGKLSGSHFDEVERRLFLVAQHALTAQLESLAEAERRGGCRMYLDLPIGAAGAGFDAWNNGDLFARGVCLGAPPDAFFADGQSWGFPPVNPERSRRDGHAYFAQSVDRHLQLAGALRLDHAAGLHRCFWVPDGMSASRGVYVRQPAEEFYAVLSILSHRRRSTIIGENLGTVPRGVNRSLKRHGVLGMSIAQFELGGRPDPLPRPRALSLAALNTHDLPPFGAFWTDEDLELHRNLGLIGGRAAEKERRRRAAMRRRVVGALTREGLLTRETARARDVLNAMLVHLASSRAEFVLVNLEDLWLERRPQNVPGVTRPENWRRRAAWNLERIVCEKPLLGHIRSLERAARRRREYGGHAPSERP